MLDAVLGLAVGVWDEVEVTDSEGAGVGARGRGGNRIQLSMSVTGPWAKLGKDKHAEIARTNAILAPSRAKLAGINCHKHLFWFPCMGFVPFLIVQ